jgi:hypothetical protein
VEVRPQFLKDPAGAPNTSKSVSLPARPGQPDVPHVRSAQGPKISGAPNFGSPFSYNAN